MVVDIWSTDHRESSKVGRGPGAIGVVGKRHNWYRVKNAHCLGIGYLHYS
jgi:hypothetical protein